MACINIINRSLHGSLPTVLHYKEHAAKEKKSNLDQKKPSIPRIPVGNKEVKGLKKKLNTIYLYKQHIIFSITNIIKHIKR